jgi:hypothetical protein
VGFYFHSVPWLCEIRGIVVGIATKLWTAVWGLNPGRGKRFLSSELSDWLLDPPRIQSVHTCVTRYVAVGSN